MTKAEIEEYLYEHIPITKAFGVKAESFSKTEVKFRAPLSNNINHRSTVFGGSISSLLITTGWAYLRLIFDEFQAIPRIVIGRSTTDYLLPVKEDFTTELIIPSEESIGQFLQMYERFGKARITLKGQIRSNGELQAEFEGNYVALNNKVEK